MNILFSLFLTLLYQLWWKAIFKFAKRGDLGLDGGNWLFEKSIIYNWVNILIKVNSKRRISEQETFCLGFIANILKVSWCSKFHLVFFFSLWKVCGNVSLVIKSVSTLLCIFIDFFQSRKLYSDLTSQWITVWSFRWLPE